MALKMETGRTTRKVEDLQHLTKQWLLMSKQETSGEICKAKWTEAEHFEDIFGKKEQEVACSEILYSWGLLCGKFGSEQNALKAIENEEVEEREITDIRGKQRSMFADVTATRTPFPYAII